MPLRNSTTMKVLVLILSSDTYPSKRNKNIINETWVKSNSENTKIYFYEAGQKTHLVNNTLYVEDSGTAQDIGKKTIAAIDWAYKNLEFDFIFRTNTSSYVNIKNLKNYISNYCISSEYVYRGVIHQKKFADQEKSLDYVNGAGIILNRESVKKIIENSNNWDHTEWDDVALGKMFSLIGIYPESGLRQEVVGNFYNNKIDTSNYHIRCRIDQIYRYPRFLEKYILKEIDNIYNKKSISLKLFKKSFFYLCKIFYIEKPVWRLYNLIFKILRKVLPKNIYSLLRKLRSERIYNKVLKYYQKDKKES